MFMARAIRAGRPLGEVGDLAWYEKVPELSQKAQAYRDVFPDRLKRFQNSPGSPNRHIVDIGAPPNSSSWHHELRHDAESVFWLLVWWVVNATPDGCTSEMPVGLWGPLVDITVDARQLDIPSSGLDPAYAPLSELLHQLGRALIDDLHWATDTPYTHPEFLHEVFQRHILNFIFENRDKNFMTLAKADRFRTPANVTMTPSLSAPQIEFVRTRSGASSKHSRDSEPEAETVSCYSILIYNCLRAAAHISGDIEEIESSLIANSL